MPRETTKTLDKLELGRFTDDVRELGNLAIDLSLIERATPHPAGRRENVFEHSLALSFVAVGIAEKYFPDLDANLVGRYGVLHDLVEIYAGDTPTHDISDAELKEKYAREAEALGLIKANYSRRFPLLISLVDDYEHQTTKEARLVRALDKCLPALLNLRSGLISFQKAYGDMTVEVFRQKHERRMSQFKNLAKEFPELIQVKEELFQLLVDTYFPTV